MSKHAPGPWRVERAEGYIQVRGAEGRLICERGEPRDTRIRGRLLREARLIAAAPELLVVLKTVRLHASGLLAETTKREMDRVIAKAEGRK